MGYTYMMGYIASLVYSGSGKHNKKAHSTHTHIYIVIMDIHFKKVQLAFWKDPSKTSSYL